jgi:hypothetical protein
MRELDKIETRLAGEIDKPRPWSGWTTCSRGVQCGGAPRCYPPMMADRARHFDFMALSPSTTVVVVADHRKRLVIGAAARTETTDPRDPDEDRVEAELVLKAR